MRIKEFSVGKQMKIGLPNYSNVTAQCYITFEVFEDEKPDWDSAWDEVNKQLIRNVNDIDPTWIKEKEYKNFFKLTVKVPKEE